MTSFEEIVRRIVREEVRAALQELPPKPDPAEAAERPGDLLTLKAAATRLGVPEATLRDWRNDRRDPPATMLGRSVRYRREDLERWIADHRDQ